MSIKAPIPKALILQPLIPNPVALLASSTADLLTDPLMILSTGTWELCASWEKYGGLE